MKKILLCLALACVAAALPAQPDWVQNTTVREQNSKKKPVPNAYVVFDGAPGKFSGGDGKVRLVFAGKKPGYYTFLLEITKEGYELVNNKDFENLKLSADEHLGADIILAPVGRIEAAKKEYYAISDRSLREGFEKEKQRLRRERDAAKLSAEHFEEQWKLLNDRYEQQQKELDALAEKFARVNFDDVSPVYQEALELFKAGKVDEAIARLESIDPAKRTRDLILKGKFLDSLVNVYQKEKTQQIANLRLLADMYSLKFDPEKAETQYDDLLRLDTTDLEILRDAAGFYRNNHRYEKALWVLPMIIAHPKAEVWRKANAYGYIGELNTKIGQLETALQAYLDVQKSYEVLLKTNPGSSFYKSNLAVSYSKLGEIHSVLGNLDKALNFFEAFGKLMKDLHEANPQNMDFKNALAVSYSKLGETHSALGNLSKSLTFFEAFSKLMEALYEAHPLNVDFKNALAISYSKLGETHSALGNLDTALTFFEDETKLFEELNKAYPKNVDFKNGLAISYEKLGETHAVLGNLDKALIFFEYYNQLGKELHEAYPKNVDFKKGLSVSYEKLGETHSTLGNMNKALAFFETFNKLMKELHETYPKNVDFKNGLAISYEKLGETYNTLGDMGKALTFFVECSRLGTELHNAYPKNLVFKDGLAISYVKLASCYLETDPPKAVSYLKEAERHFSELHEISPNNAQFKQYLEMVREILRLLTQLNTNAVDELNSHIQNETDILSQYELYTTLCDTLRRRAAHDPTQKAALAEALNSRAWRGLVLEKFAAAEADAREGMALSTGNKFLGTCLAPALLLQGKRTEALQEYEKWKDQPFGEHGSPTYREAFLNDLNAFEEVGIIPPERTSDVEAVRRLLRR